MDQENIISTALVNASIGIFAGGAAIIFSCIACRTNPVKKATGVFFSKIKNVLRIKENPESASIFIDFDMYGAPVISEGSIPTASVSMIEESHGSVPVAEVSNFNDYSPFN